MGSIFPWYKDQVTARSPSPNWGVNRAEGTSPTYQVTWPQCQLHFTHLHQLLFRYALFPWLYLYFRSYSKLLYLFHSYLQKHRDDILATKIQIMDGICWAKRRSNILLSFIRIHAILSEYWKNICVFLILLWNVCIFKMFVIINIVYIYKYIYNCCLYVIRQ